MIKKILAVGLLGLFASLEAHASEVTGFRSARFGATEREVINAAVADLGVKANEVVRAKDPVTQVTTLEFKSKSFAPLNMPATVTYVMGHKCNCLVQVGIMWTLSDKITVDQRKESILGVSALVDRFVKSGWEKDEMVTSRVTGDIKEGSENAIIFFRGQNKAGGAITLIGAPVKMTKAQPEKKGEDAFAANVDGIKTITLAYEKDAVNPDIYRVDVSGF